MLLIFVSSVVFIAACGISPVDRKSCIHYYYYYYYYNTLSINSNALFIDGGSPFGSLI
jgi:hypothetical protein